MSCKFLILVLPFFFACKTKVEENKLDVDWSKEKSTEMNKDFAIEEDLRIKMYLDSRPNLKTTQTGSGLRYAIYKNGTGEKALSEKIAIVKYSIELLDGTKCYATEENESAEFRIDRSDVETGVQEGIKKMRIGDKAKFILPNHLAHGLVGDMGKIPPLQTIVIDIELIDLK